MRRLAWWLIDWRRLLASHLRLRNGRRIRGSVRRALQRATGQRSAARPRRSAPPPLHPARTLSLEPRHLLSTLTAVADTARVRGGAPLELDPLRNDHSSAGPLHLTAVTAVSHGSAQLRDLDDDGQFDRVVFTPSPGYTGPAGFTYFVRDGSGAVATATVSLTIDSAQSLLTSNASGQLAVVGGLGGVGYRADPRAGFTPSLLGNYSREESAANDAWSPKLSIAGQSQSSTGTQGLTHATQATYADGSNWTYTESVAFQYSQSASVPGGDSRWLWGGYTYIFSVTMVAGVRSTSLAYTGFDSERAVLTSTGDNSSFTNSSLASRVYRLDVGHLSSPITGNSGWSMETTVQSRTFSGQGTYHRPLPGGLLDGTTVATGQSVDLSFTTQHHTQDTAGNWSVIGQASASGTGTSDSGWSGSGPWSSGPWVGAVSSDAGGQQSLSHYSAVATLNTDGRWNWTGTGRLTDSGYNATRQEAAAVESLQWPGGTRESQHRQLAESSSQTRADISWQLVDDQWEVAGGTKWSNGGSRSQLNSTTQGTYRWHDAGGAVDGIFGSTDQGTFRSDYSTVSHWNLGDWTTAGTGQTDSTRQVVSSSLGTGTYHTIDDQSARSIDRSPPESAPSQPTRPCSFTSRPTGGSMRPTGLKRGARAWKPPLAGQPPAAWARGPMNAGPATARRSPPGRSPARSVICPSLNHRLSRTRLAVNSLRERGNSTRVSPGRNSRPARRQSVRGQALANCPAHSALVCPGTSVRSSVHKIRQHPPLSRPGPLTWGGSPPASLWPTTPPAIPRRDSLRGNSRSTVAASLPLRTQPVPPPRRPTVPAPMLRLSLARG